MKAKDKSKDRIVFAINGSGGVWFRCFPDMFAANSKLVCPDRGIPDLPFSSFIIPPSSFQELIHQLPVNPDALQNSQASHGNEKKGSAITDQWKW